MKGLLLVFPFKGWIPVCSDVFFVRELLEAGAVTRGSAGTTGHVTSLPCGPIVASAAVGNTDLSKHFSSEVHIPLRGVISGAVE